MSVVAQEEVTGSDLMLHIETTHLIQFSDLALGWEDHTKLKAFYNFPPTVGNPDRLYLSFSNIFLSNHVTVCCGLRTFPIV